MNREDIDNLIAHLIAIQRYAKDIHYNCSGPNFYGNHEFADRFTVDMDDFIDSLNEVCLLGHCYKPLHSSEYLEKASKIIPFEMNFKTLKQLCVETLDIIEGIKGIWRGDEDLLGTISRAIQNNVGLLNIMFGQIEGY